MALGPDIVALVVVVAVVSAATDGTAVTAESVGVAVADDDATGAVEADVAAAEPVASAASAAVATGALGLQELPGRLPRTRCLMILFLPPCPPSLISSLPPPRHRLVPSWVA